MSEAEYRAEWLSARRADTSWVIVTVSEVAAAKADFEAERDDWKTWHRMKCDALKALEQSRDELRSVLRFVERIVSQHGQKDFMTAEEALSWIQHHPGVEAITESYANGKVPETPNPWNERDELRAEVEQLKADKSRIGNVAHAAVSFVGSGNYLERIKAAHESIDEAMKGAE